MKTNNIFYAFCLSAVLVLLGTACEKKVEEEFVPERFFTPGRITVNVVDTSAELVWAASLFSGNARPQYTVEISTDSLFEAAPYLTEVVDSSFFVMLEDEAELGQKYFGRVKANAKGNTADSRWEYSSSFIILGEPIFPAVETADITFSSVILRWTPESDVTHFMLNDTRYDILPAENAAGEKLIGNLSPKTDYVAVLLNGAFIRGTQNFRTPAIIPTGPNVVVLDPTDDIGTMLANAVDGNIFVLLEGTEFYANSGISLPEGVSVTLFGEDVPVKPVLALNGITLPANAGTIRFENLDITGYQENDASLTKRQYIFNQSVATTTQEVSFENCIIRNFANTPFRLQSTNAISIGTLSYNNCVISDIGNNGANGTYAFIHSGAANGVIRNISITNSTLHTIGYSIILQSTNPAQTVLIENTTFYNTVGNGRYFIDFGSQPTTSSFMLRNVIIGKTLAPESNGRGIRSGTSYTLANVYKTADAIFASNVITGISEYSGSSDDLFVGPANGDFSIKDAGFGGAATAGDPRWR